MWARLAHFNLIKSHERLHKAVEITLTQRRFAVPVIFSMALTIEVSSFTVLAITYELASDVCTLIQVCNFNEIVRICETFVVL